MRAQQGIVHGSEQCQAGHLRTVTSEVARGIADDGVHVGLGQRGVEEHVSAPDTGVEQTHRRCRPIRSDDPPCEILSPLNLLTEVKVLDGVDELATSAASSRSGNEWRL